MIKEDLTGRVFGRLTVLKEADNRSKQGYVQWVCSCSCPEHNLVTVTSYNLRSGKTKSCGCLQRDTVKAMNVSRSKYAPDDRNTRLYRIWKGMIARTTYESQLSYNNYGGRGIVVCDEWRSNYLAFKYWAIENGYNDDLTIDRIDYNGNYTPDNCRWVTRKEQNNNQRSNLRLSFGGESHTAAQWAEILGVAKDCIYKRIRKGGSLEKILKEFIEKGESV